MARRQYRVGFLQFAPRFGDVERNTSRLVERLRRARADLLVLPELCLTGYNFRDRAELETYAERPSQSAAIKALRRLCVACGLHLVLGFAERDGDRIYNSALLLGPRGIRCTYRKAHLFMRENEIFDAGDQPPPVVSVRGLRLGMMICWDWALPEMARTLALKGADLIAHPSNLVLPHCQRAMYARCVENGVYAVTANRTGIERRPHGSLRFSGRSQILGPRGELLARAKAQGQPIEICRVDPRRARDKKITPYNDLLGDRRPGLYF